MATFVLVAYRETRVLEICMTGAGLHIDLLCIALHAVNVHLIISARAPVDWSSALCNQRTSTSVWIGVMHCVISARAPVRGLEFCILYDCSVCLLCYASPGPTGSPTKWRIQSHRSLSRSMNVPAQSSVHSDSL
eukprot:scpid52590/ scgid17995/ 